MSFNWRHEYNETLRRLGALEKRLAAAITRADNTPTLGGHIYKGHTRSDFPHITRQIDNCMMELSAIAFCLRAEGIYFTPGEPFQEH